MRGKISAFLPSVIVVLAALGVIQLAGRVLNIPSFIMPRPTAVFQLLLNSKIPWLKNFTTTFSEVTIGFLLAAALGTSLGIAMSLSRILNRVLQPIIVAAQVMPKVAFVPMLFLWLGLSPLPRILTVVLVCFFPMVIDTSTGLTVAESEYRDFARSYKAGRLTVLRRVTIPAAAPSIFAGLKVSITLATVGAVVAEFVQSSDGLGFLILSAQQFLNTTLAFAAATLLILMGFALYAVIIALEHYLVYWEK